MGLTLMGDGVGWGGWAGEWRMDGRAIKRAVAVAVAGRGGVGGEAEAEGRGGDGWMEWDGAGWVGLDCPPQRND